MTIEYRSKTVSSPWPLRIIKIGIVLLLLFAVIGAVAIVSLVRFVQSSRAVVAAFEQRTSSSVLLGKTAPQVIATLGTPYFDTRNQKFVNGQRQGSDQDCVIAYYGPFGAICRIEVTSGKVSNVEHYVK